ncbi:hypothetical protein [Conexibacter sp. CPCC 206217]|uniref:hypothetical protein n=1 Tax=Conexibacter sp. CPCC 206217 TaxID=3064574 RepID=UPI0027203B0B|nr:hypothetical protein [Conexibacter sp. CPCC 206217]MDO8213496.1 hypothetical protein [Conexibacter sp. CPCC 206217]
MADEASAGALEIRGPALGLLDDPLELQARGLGGITNGVLWRARVRDDDGRVWRAVAPWPQQLVSAWAPAKSSAGDVAALQSLRPVALDLRVEAADGRTATRTFTRRLLGDGVRVRRWREGLAATLYLPAADAHGPAGAETTAAAGANGPAGAATTASAGASAPDASTAASTAAVVLDATAGEEAAVAVALAAALLASRGVLAFAVAAPRGGVTDPAPLLATAAELLAQVPAAADAPGGVQILPAPLPLPPGVPSQIREDVARRAAAWDELLARLGARPRAASTR